MEQPENYSHAINRLTIYNGLTSWSKLANSIAGYNASSFGDIKIVEKSGKKFHLEEKSNYLGQLVRLRKLVDEAKESHRSVVRAHQSSLSSSYSEQKATATALSMKQPERDALFCIGIDSKSDETS
ncbi:hypothetical protein HZH68_002239 [Vespula germanica]|uniref:Uncharacterized protein n=1 Tax=Vespula germanica TaxID=30212 RepID=A0A834NLK1_VESGE|nr:hypothetical protein HZH68_002239 [Vespula germanica]